ncbi:hypothetical protein HID58_071359 [Brassica napus]|uniref:Uncharacterized protein n=2 Tax=Brassica napus TaxID=3708 RepID=A0ABQ7Z1H9_BRANA|nr:hypothetical protein HID58_071359 [Brassica napus]CDY33833.1 BnaCnng07510D [Brassica napus]
MLAPDALELEEEQWMKQEETMCYCALLQVPLLRASPNVEVKDKELVVSYPAKENDTLAEHMVRNQHLPSGITVESFGILENRFSNRIKALKWLKAKLLLIAKGRYVSKGQKIVVDLKTAHIAINFVATGN